jgi:hypothetical protein
MAERRIRQPAVAFAIEADAMDLELQKIVPVARRVEEHACGFIDLQDVST